MTFSFWGSCAKARLLGSFKRMIDNKQVLLNLVVMHIDLRKFMNKDISTFIIRVVWNNENAIDFNAKHLFHKYC